MDDLFSMALEARCKWALSRAYHPDITGDDRDWHKYSELCEDAELLARDAGQDYPNEPCPHLLTDVSLLRDAFEHTSGLVRRAEADMIERGEREAREAERDERQRIEALITAEDWDALGLPTPDDLTKLLLSGESTTVAGHWLVYEKDIDTVWYTSPYGIDGAICDSPNANAIKTFLVDMARGVEYGPIP